MTLVQTIREMSENVSRFDEFRISEQETGHTMTQQQDIRSSDSADEQLDADGPLARQIEREAMALGQHLMASGRVVTTAESCTGGLIAGALTEVPGSSDWFEQGLVTYSNEAKQQLLGVPATIFSEEGAVSEACVQAMASGAQARSGADVAIAVSGIAGPGGGSAEKPVGTVWLAWAFGSELSSELFMFNGTRRAVRQQAVLSALRGTIARVQNSGKSSL